MLAAKPSSESPLVHGDADWHSAHAQLMGDEKTWQTMAFAYLENTGRELIEYRHCPRCRSTIGRPITPEDAAELLNVQQAKLEWSRAELAGTTQAPSPPASAGRAA